MKEVYADLYESFSKFESEYESSGFVEVLMETDGSFVDLVVLSYKNSVVNNSDILRCDTGNL